MYGFLMQCSPFCVICGCDPPIIHILAGILFILFEEWCEVLSHGSLEECRCVAHPKVHDFWNVCSIACLDCCFVSVFFGKADVIISVSNVKLGEQRLPLESVHGFSYVWHWIMVSYSPGIHPSVVNDDAFLSAIFLANEEDGGDKFRWSLFNSSECLLLFKPGFFNLSLCFRARVWFAFNRGRRIR